VEASASALSEAIMKKTGSSSATDAMIDVKNVEDLTKTTVFPAISRSLDTSYRGSVSVNKDIT
jgi:hypothetical protein